MKPIWIEMKLLGKSFRRVRVCVESVEEATAFYDIMSMAVLPVAVTINIQGPRRQCPENDARDAEDTTP